MKIVTRSVLLASLLTAGVMVAARGQSILDSPHNLSAAGPNGVRALSEEQVCIFCHTSHNASPVQPLWNRDLPVSAYSVYQSNALDSQPGQPTGTSKLCLSCHDGTIALGSVVSRSQIIQMAGGITTMPPGAANLGTDLSDDHPISFPYDSFLASQDSNLVDPVHLPPQLARDAANEVQCTTCHDPHDNSFGHFLTMNNADSAMCRACHQISSTTIAPHVDCRSCHQVHSAPSGPYLLSGDQVTSTCLDCHDGSVFGAGNIAADLMKLSGHDTQPQVDPPDPIPGHVMCADCHEPHTMVPGAGVAPAVHPNFGDIDGISASGGPVAQANYEYEVCFKCHADDSSFDASWVPRQITQVNTRFEFDPSAVSFHPVMSVGRNPDVPSLKPGWTESSIMHCSDCHGSDTSVKAGGSGPNGMHGSNQEPLLLARYETADFTPESAAAYALCYQCHYRDERDGILKDRTFEHEKHVVDEKTPCSACHDAHGVSSFQGSMTNNSHLINFDTSIVFPDPETGLLRYESTGKNSGRCFLTCHGEDHSPEEYSR